MFIFSADFACPLHLLSTQGSPEWTLSVTTCQQIVGFIFLSSSVSHSGSFFLDILSESQKLGSSHCMDELGELGRPGSSEGMKVLGSKDFSKHASSGLSQGHSAFLALSYWLLSFFHPSAS